MLVVAVDGCRAPNVVCNQLLEELGRELEWTVSVAFPLTDLRNVEPAFRQAGCAVSVELYGVKRYEIDEAGMLVVLERDR